MIDFRKKPSMVTTSFKIPKELIQRIRARKLNLGAICRQALLDALKRE